MSEFTTAARPYAKAAFEVAQAESKQAEWSDALQFIDAVVCNDEFAAVIDNPAMGAEAKGDILLSICADKISDTQKNFIKVMAENSRLMLMPEIVVLFEALRAAAENTVEAIATAAYALSDAQVQSMTDALKKKLGCEVTLSTEVDSSLIGGVIIRAGDLVIDGSTKAKIESLTQAVGH
ncbi:MAG: F0F1 ATP synthase subunit delta [endosymbiont of Galathealinum brachiosum]|uniref:ATP synthase subunit delta n=1 Tax=endosymbiont of Galathealinum brachiosum TaxID=2200906 RepID=A0A370DCX1_9GAMM|nr:MAG: F0F1 ATP synthase subunit delta [endosymbiont of Galathealinum brachiosum]